MFYLLVGVKAGLSSKDIKSSFTSAQRIHETKQHRSGVKKRGGFCKILKSEMLKAEGGFLTTFPAVEKGDSLCKKPFVTNLKDILLSRLETSASFNSLFCFQKVGMK
jgi:hypothetical protein